jgi:chemotaxis protein MotB
MVEPSGCLRTTRLWIVARVALCALGLAGCSLVEKSRLDDCHRLSQTLQAENTRLKDQTISLRSQNQDLNQRAVADARRLRLQDEEIERLVQSVTAYQQDREQLAAAFERLKGQIRSTVNPVSAGLVPRLEDLARTHPGWEFDPQRSVLSIPAVQMFEAGSDRLRPEARTWLRETAALWSSPDARDIDLLVVGRNEASAIRPAGLAPAGTQAEGRALGRDRAARVRDVLAGEARLGAGQIEVAGFELPPPSGSDGSDEAVLERNRRIEIHLRRHAPATPGAAAPQAAAPSDPPAPAAAAAARSGP